MSIVIVDDNPINAKLIDIALRAKGYQTQVASNGAEALRILSEHEDVDLIITDYMMPEMNGLELIRKARQLPTGEDVHIIVTSAYSNLETVKLAMEWGCDDFLAKPIDKARLVERVAQILKEPSVVLREKFDVMHALDIGSEEYDDLARMFAAQLSAALSVVQAEERELGEESSDHVWSVLKELAESAAFLGGEQFVQLYNKYRAGRRLTRPKCAALVRALQQLKAALAHGGFAASPPPATSPDV